MERILRENNNKASIGEMEMITGIHHASVTVSDMDKSLLFYKDKLGLTLLYTTEGGGEETSRGVGVTGAKMRISVLKAGDDSVELIQYVAPKGKPCATHPNDTGSMHLALRVTDVRAKYDELKSKGINFNTPPNEITEGPMKGWLWTYFKDPDGAQLELVEQR